MARVQKDIVSYFPHDATACDGDTLIVLQSRFGNDGYAFWFKLLEKLCSTEGHCIDCSNQIKWQLLLAKTGVNELLGVEIMNLLVEMKAIDKELWGSKLIWCQKLVDNIADVYKNRRREIPQKPVTTSIKAITTNKNSINTGESTQSKTKQSKEKNIHAQLFNLFWEEYPKKKDRAKAERAFNTALKGKTNGYTDETFTDMLIAKVKAIRDTDNWIKDNRQYTPLATTWLNGKRWEDEVEEQVKTQYPTWTLEELRSEY